MKKYTAFLLSMLLPGVCLASCTNESVGTPIETLPDKVVISIENYGDIHVTLRPDCAPITVNNFKKLVSEQYYDGLIFHRVIQNFMIQGGWGELSGKGSAKSIKGEFASNGVNNPLKHTRGVLSMARTKVNNSASSQFFICQKDCSWLDGDYAAFGIVTEGMEIVDEISSLPTDPNDRPYVDVVITSIRFE